MSAAPSPDVRDVDLGSLEFWGRPAEERDEYFAELRRHAPISRHRPPEDLMGLPDQERMSYWAIVRFQDVRNISRDPKTFCSGQGTQFADAPPVSQAPPPPTPAAWETPPIAVKTSGNPGPSAPAPPPSQAGSN